MHLVKDEKEREKIVQESMDAFAKHHNREREVYQRQVEEWYTAKRVEWEQSNVTESATKEQRAKIRARRRLIAHAERDTEDGELKGKLDVIEERRIEAWIETWAKKGMEEAEKYMINCRHCMEAPDTPLEKKLGKELVKKTKARTKEVLKKADVRHLHMEYPKAYATAADEVIYIMGEEKKKEIMAQMKVAAAQYENKEAGKEKQREDTKRKMKALDQVRPVERKRGETGGENEETGGEK